MGLRELFLLKIQQCLARKMLQLTAPAQLPETLVTNPSTPELSERGINGAVIVPGTVVLQVCPWTSSSSITGE